MMSIDAPKHGGDSVRIISTCNFWPKHEHPKYQQSKSISCLNYTEFRSHLLLRSMRAMLFTANWLTTSLKSITFSCSAAS